MGADRIENDPANCEDCGLSSEYGGTRPQLFPLSRWGVMVCVVLAILNHCSGRIMSDVCC